MQNPSGDKTAVHESTKQAGEPITADQLTSLSSPPLKKNCRVPILKTIEILCKAAISGGCINFYFFMKQDIPTRLNLLLSSFSTIGFLLHRFNNALANNALYSDEQSKSNINNETGFLFKWAMHAALFIAVYDTISPWIAILHFFTAAESKFTRFDYPLQELPTWKYLFLIPCVAVSSQFIAYRWSSLPRGWRQFKKTLYDTSSFNIFGKSKKSNSQHLPLLNSPQPQVRTKNQNNQKKSASLEWWQYCCFIYFTIGNTIAFALFNFFLGSSTSSTAYSLVCNSILGTHYSNATKIDFSGNQTVTPNFIDPCITKNQAKIINNVSGIFFFAVGIIVTLCNSSMTRKLFSGSFIASIKKTYNSYPFYTLLVLIINLLDSINKVTFSFKLATVLPFLQKNTLSSNILGALLVSAQVPPYIVYNVEKSLPSHTKKEEELSKILNKGVTISFYGDYLTTLSEVEELQGTVISQNGNTEYRYPFTEKNLHIINSLKQPIARP